MTGNVIDLAVAVLLATAVGTVVSSFTNDVMMPVVGQFTGGVDFADLKIVLSEAELAADGLTDLASRHASAGGLEEQRVATFQSI